MRSTFTLAEARYRHAVEFVVSTAENNFAIAEQTLGVYTYRAHKLLLSGHMFLLIAQYSKVSKVQVVTAIITRIMRNAD